MKAMSVLLFYVLLASATTIERDTLANGLVVLTVEAHKLPMVVMRTSIHAGSVFDPQGKEGLANVVSHMLMRGTEHRSADEIVETIESVGGDLSPFADEDYAGITGRVLSKDVSLLIDVLVDCLQYPLFDSLELHRVQHEIISGINTQMNDPFEVSERAFRNLVFQNHPLRHFPEGFDSTVAQIGVADVHKFYDAYYAPNNSFIVFIGDFYTDSLIADLNRKLGGWKRKEIDIIEVVAPVACTTSVGKIIPMDISQAYILLGNTGPKYGARDWYEARVMNYILGGAGLTSRISQKIREEQGLAYIAFSYFRRYKTGGYFTAEVQTQKRMATEVMQILIDEMTKIQDTISIDELNRAKKFYTGYFPLSHDTYGEMTNVVSQIEIQNLGLDYLSRFVQLIEGVTLDELKVAAQKYIHPECFYVVIVGDVKPEDIKVDGIEWFE